eukprot:scpid21070/ scgid17740/ Amyloid beta A4 precursor protein-binding family B member 1-interacting protein; APBB1-interacting protein 1
MSATAGRRTLDLLSWLQSLDLEQYVGRFQTIGLFEPRQCLSLTEIGLTQDLDIHDRSHRETILAAVQRLAKELCSDNLSDDSWPESEQSSGRNSVVFGTNHAGSLVSSHDPSHPPGLEVDLNLPPPPPDLIAPPPPQQDPTSWDTNMPLPPPPPPSIINGSSATNNNVSAFRDTSNQPVTSYSPTSMQRMYKQPSLVNVQQDEFDLDMLLADLVEIEQSSIMPNLPMTQRKSPVSRPVSSLSTQSSSSSLNVKPPVVTIRSTATRSDSQSSPGPLSKPAAVSPAANTTVDDDDFSKILADLESLSSSTDMIQSSSEKKPAVTENQHSYGKSNGAPASHAHSASPAMLRQPSELDLTQQINILSGGLGAPVTTSDMSHHMTSPTSSSSLSSPSYNGSHFSASSTSRPSSMASSEPFTPSSSATSTLSTPRHTSAVSPHPSISSASSSSELDELNQLSAHLTRELNSDNVSTTTSEDQQSTSVRTVPNDSLVRLPNSKSLVRVNEELAHLEKDLAADGTLSRTERDSRLKQAKMQVAMDKLKEANKKKLVLKAYNDDGSSKMIVIDEMMTAYEVTQRLIRKNRVKASTNYVLIEQLAEHYIERRIEDHEVMVPILECWGVNSPNTIQFTEKPDKYMLFKRPQLFMPPGHDYAPGKKSTVSEPKKRDLILKDLFVAQALPDLEGNLMVKEGRKGPWKRHFFVFRKSGLYFSPKGKTVATKDLQRFTDLKDMVLYTGDAYRKKYKAPTDMCFTLKRFLSSDSRKMLHFCAETMQDLNAWSMMIKLAQHGSTLQENYDRTNRDLPWIATETEEEIDGLVRMQREEQLEAAQRQRSASIGNRLRHGTSANNTLRKNEKGPRTTRSATVAAAEFTLRARGGSFRADSRPNSSFSRSIANPDDDEDIEDSNDTTMTPFQQMFGSAWKEAPEKPAVDASGGRKIELMEPDFNTADDFSPTPMATSPFLASEDGMYNLRLT